MDINYGVLITASIIPFILSFISYKFSKEEKESDNLFISISGAFFITGIIFSVFSLTIILIVYFSK